MDVSDELLDAVAEGDTERRACPSDKTTTPPLVKRGTTTEAPLATLEWTQLYSEELGIDLCKGIDRELFKWFLASVLFGGRISETIAKNTYRALVRHGLVTPRKILAAGWDFLVDPIMREGGYVRYDGRKSTQLLRDCEELLHEYGGSLNRLHDGAVDAADLERRLNDFHGVGPVTANIFLRELRPYWPKANPEPLPNVRETARWLGIDLRAYDRKSLTFARVEAGLLRQRRKLRPRRSSSGAEMPTLASRILRAAA